MPWSVESPAQATLLVFNGNAGHRAYRAELAHAFLPHGVALTGWRRCVAPPGHRRRRRPNRRECRDLTRRPEAREAGSTTGIMCPCSPGPSALPSSPSASSPGQGVGGDWQHDRAVPDPRQAWRRRHGRGVSRARHEAQSRRRDQGAARVVRGRCRSPRAVHARSEDARVAQSSEHRRRSTDSKKTADVTRARDGAGRGRRPVATRIAARRRSRSPRRCRSRGRSPRRSRPRTSRASSIATSSPRTSRSAPTAP